MKFFHEQKKEKRNRLKNYEKAKQSPLRHLANKKVLIIGNLLFFLLLSFVLNGLLSFFSQLTSKGLFSGEIDMGWTSLFYYKAIVEYPVFYFLLLLAFGLLAAKVTYDFFESFAPLEEELVQGTMEWETPEELLKQYPIVPVNPLTEDQDFFPGKPGYPISRVPFEIEEVQLQQSTEENKESSKPVLLSEEMMNIESDTISVPPEGLNTHTLDQLMDEAKERQEEVRIKGKRAIKLFEELHVPEVKPRRFYYLVAQEPSNSIVLALTRGGKDVYFINPFLDILTRAERIEDRPSFVMTATKGDEPRLWYDTLKKRGYIVRVCNVVRQYYSDPYNPLSIVYNYYKKYLDLKKTNKYESARFLTEAENELRRSANTFFQENPNGGGQNDKFWVKACQNLFMATGLAIVDQAVREDDSVKFNPYTIYNIVNEMNAIRISENNTEYIDSLTEDSAERRHLLGKYDGKSALDVFFMELPVTHPAKKWYGAILASGPAEVTMGNIITHFDGDMEMFLTEANAKMSAADDAFDFEDIGFGDRPVACFIVMSQVEKSNNPLGMLYLEQVYQVNEKRCTLETPSRTYRDIHFIIQEAGNLGVAVQNLANKWTSGLGQGLFFHLVLQDLEQLESLYGASVKKTIIGNTGNLVYIRSGSLDTNQYIEARLGKRSNYSKSRQRQSPTSVKVSQTENSERIELKSVSELERLKKSETIVLRLSHVDDLSGEPIYQYPIYNSIETDTNMIPFYEYRKNKELSWDEIPVNNSFMDMEIEDLLVTLKRVPKEEKKIVPKLVTERTKQTKPYQENVNSNRENNQWQVPEPPEPPRRNEWVPQGIEEDAVDVTEQIEFFSHKEMYDAYQKAKNEQEKEEISRKREMFKQLQHILPMNFDQFRVKEFFSAEEIQKLTIVLRIKHLRNKAVQNEFQTICEQQTLGSMISFIASNDKGGLTTLMANKIVEMKEGEQ